MVGKIYMIKPLFTHVWAAKFQGKPVNIKLLAISAAIKAKIKEKSLNLGAKYAIKVNKVGNIANNKGNPTNENGSAHHQVSKSTNKELDTQYNEVK